MLAFFNIDAGLWEILTVFFLSMTPIIELFRGAYLGVEMNCMNYVWISCATTLAVLFIGVLLFTRIERTFMDTV